MSTVDDAWRRFESGDEEGFTDWMRQVELPLRLRLQRFARSVDVEAVLQDTLMVMFQIGRARRPALDEENASLRYASAVARRAAIKGIERGKRVVEFNGWDDSISPAPQPPDPILREAIAQCLERLPTQKRRVIRARLTGGPDKKLAAELGMSLNTFLQNVVRARKAVTRCLERRGVRLEELWPMTDRVPEPEVLIEAAAPAFRERDAEGHTRASPAWWDLTPDDRARLFERQFADRQLERALDENGLSATGHRVLARVTADAE